MPEPNNDFHRVSQGEGGRGAALPRGRQPPLRSLGAAAAHGGPGLSPRPGRGAGPRGVPAPALGGRSAPGGAVPRRALSGERRFNGRRGSSRRARERRAQLGSRAPGFPLSPLTAAGCGTSRRAARARGGPTCVRPPGGGGTAGSRSAAAVTYLRFSQKQKHDAETEHPAPGNGRRSGLQVLCPCQGRVVLLALLIKH